VVIFRNVFLQCCNQCDNINYCALCSGHHLPVNVFIAVGVVVVIIIIVVVVVVVTVKCSRVSRLDTNYYLRQGGYVFVGFCLSVCVCVSNITQKVMDGSF